MNIDMLIPKGKAKGLFKVIDKRKGHPEFSVGESVTANKVLLQLGFIQNFSSYLGCVYTRPDPFETSTKLEQINIAFIDLADRFRSVLLSSTKRVYL